MPLFLIEATPEAAERGAIHDLTKAVDVAARAAGGGLVEAQATADLKQVFAVVEAATVDAVHDALAAAGLAVDDVAEVRLVGATLADVKAAAGDSPRYLVEWDLPEGLDMDSYLARKQAKSPRYAEVPEVAFRRTYVREDLDKCLCFYDGDCEADVRRARTVVEAPVDRLHELA